VATYEGGAGGLNGRRAHMLPGPFAVDGVHPSLLGEASGSCAHGDRGLLGIYNHP